VGTRFSAPIQTGPGAYPASCTMCTGSFPGVKRPGRGVDHPPPSSAKVKERVELYLYSSSVSSCQVIGRALNLPTCPLIWTSYQSVRCHNQDDHNIAKRCLCASSCNLVRPATETSGSVAVQLRVLCSTLENDFDLDPALVGSILSSLALWI
jgi:hypothetical protein